MPFV
jgi:hypothetical protein